MSAVERERLSRELRVAMMSGDAWLAADAAAALRRLNKAPTLPRRARKVSARRRSA